ncbi:MAG: hypothetical protein SVK08_01525 [Halobacteriota archaeon]|nr:hypothetical protein [Halobacteriota archaeon]
MKISNLKVVNEITEDGLNNGALVIEESPGQAYCIAKAPKYATKEQWEEHAGYIAMCCDHVDILLRALEDCLSNDFDTNTPTSKTDKIRMKAREAIRKVKDGRTKVE